MAGKRDVTSLLTLSFPAAAGKMMPASRTLLMASRNAAELKV